MKKTLLVVMLGVLGWIGRPVDLGAALVIDATAVTPGSAPVGVATTVLVTARISEPTVLPEGVNLQRLDTAGRVVSIMGLLRDDGANGDAAAGDGTFSLRATIFEQSPGPLTLRVSAAFRGSLTRALSAPFTVNITGSTGTGIAILAPADLAYLSTSPIVVSGTVGDPQAKVTINGVPATVGTGTFQASVPLVEGTNTLTAVAANSGGSTSTSSVQVTLDTTPPHVAIESPADGLKTTDSTVTVSGTVNDIVVGTVNAQQAQVTVNGAAAVVGNRSFLAQGVALALGANTIQAVARDRSGNSVTTSVVVTRVAATEPSIRIVSGNNQSAPVSTSVAAPLVIVLDNGLGQPAAGVPVVFRVTDNNGIVTAGGNSNPSLAVTTDAAGRAQVSLQLGSRAGSGSNRVEATAAGFVGTAAFTATGTATGASLITVDSGNNQTGALAAKLAFPFVVVVTDAGFNRLGGVPVTFTVKQGGGSLAGKQTLQMNTDPDGRAAAFLSLGTEPGLDNNIVEASFSGNKGQPAAFIASAKTPGKAADTRITGVVLDNSNTPIEGVTVRLFQTHQGINNNTPIQVGTPVKTDAQGQFLMAGAPVGFFKLMADGTTVLPARGVFPTLEYDIVTVAGQENTVGMPLLLPILDQTNKLCVSETEGGTLTLPAVPGFSLRVAPGTATFPGGSRSGCVTVSTVNADKSPMTPGFGQQPRFLITIQPVGTMFNGPAPITMPNVDGLKPGQVTELYSYDHDLATFVAIGTGTVSEDGLLIKSDPGVGILKAGWHCGGSPNTTGPVAPLNITVSPMTVVKAVEEEFTITASGTPPLDGSYVWPALSGILEYKTPPSTCNNATSCTATVVAKQPGDTTVNVCFRCTTTNQQVCKDVQVKVWAVDTVAFEAIDSPLDANPNAGGGQRIFAEKQTATDSVDRKRVRVRAKITPVVPNVTVYFRSLDVDDPSTDAAPVDANGATGNDNRGASGAGTLSATSATTDAAGVAIVELTVTRQPGDNFKAAAAGRQAYLTGLTVDTVNLRDADGATLPTAKGKATDLLTVWRKVHVETDSMGVVTGNLITGVVTGMNSSQATVQVDANLADGSRDRDSLLGAANGRFENGTLTVGTVSSAINANGTHRFELPAALQLPFTMTKGTATATGLVTGLEQNGGIIFPATTVLTVGASVGDFSGGTLTIAGVAAPAPVQSSGGTSITLTGHISPAFSAVDDDSVSGDVTPADTSLLTTVFAPAYVVPAFDVGDNNSAVAFVANAEPLSTTSIYDFDAIATEADADFWTVYLLGSYQGNRAPTTFLFWDLDPSADFDPNSESGVLGVVDDINGVGAKVFKESLAEAGTTAVVGDAPTTAHEIGHLFNGLHGDLGLMSQSGSRTTTAFSAVSLNKIRSIAHP